jgi:hypothetical protein
MKGSRQIKFGSNQEASQPRVAAPQVTGPFPLKNPRAVLAAVELAKISNEKYSANMPTFLPNK